MHGKRSGIDPEKIRRARELLGFESDEETIEVALDLLILDDSQMGVVAQADPADRGPGRLAGGGARRNADARTADYARPTTSSNWRRYSRE